MNIEDCLNLTLGLPGGAKESCFKNNNKRCQLETNVETTKRSQVVGWPPVRKKSFQERKGERESVMYVKVSMDGAPYLRKIDLKLYQGYSDLLKASENMFKLTIAHVYAPTYEDKDGDWMLVGDVPWE
ncbi:hypothetical protein L1987_19061 [Smallanthus sonchifolius]|uniref:Uncharacterized protein n=1 Tax=Smallanthus sonchifolius TaxID=185202 RepID=A0ACB9J3Z8_9ASTR|nr:hypothetical protein L1987_19061 [Smallanthus sonchifolius]